MKKLILSLFLFCSVFAFSQGTIPIPQIIGLPAALASKVDKVTGKSLVADTSIVKLTGIQSGSQVNKIEGIQKNGVDLTITGKKVNVIVPTTPSEVGAEPANTNIQSHISSTSNPHSVTKSQVGLGNVDNTSDINKPISTATQTALDGKQLIGTYATGTGTANGTNTGDETLTSIKTKLGAATSVSDGYLKYQDFVRFDGKQPAGAYLTAEVDGSTTNEIQDLSLSGNTLTLSSDATTVNISQATAVLANTAKTSNATHTGDVTGSTALTLATVNSNIGKFNNITINAKGLATAGSNVSYEPSFSKNTAFNKNFGTTTGTVLEGRTFGSAAGSAVGDFQPAITGLATNYIPKWNGSSLVNSLISDNGSNLSIDANVTNAYHLLNRNSLTTEHGFSWSTSNTVKWFFGQRSFNLEDGLSLYSSNLGGNAMYFRPSGEIKVGSTTPSTSPTTGALVVNGGIGADHVRANNFYGSGSNLTGIQLPITLTTNGTSGDATFSGNVLNVPNYGVSGGVNQTQTTVNGSTSGTMVCSMPYQTGSYKKVLIALDGLNGSATYTFPSSFSRIPDAVGRGSNGVGISALSTTSITITSTGSTGWCIIEGY